MFSWKNTVATLLSSAALLWATHVAGKDLVLGFLPEEPAPTIAQALSELLTEQNIALQPFATVAELQQAIVDGNVDLAILEEPEKTVDGLYWVSALYPSVLHMLTRQPAPLPQLLDSERLYVGPAGGIADRLARSLRGEYGLSGDANLLNNPFGVTQPENYFIFGGLLSADAISRLPAYQLLSLSPIEQWQRGSLAEAIAFRHPNLFPILVPADLYPVLSDTPVISLAVTTLLVGGHQLREDTAYDIAAQIDQNFTHISNLYPLARTLAQQPASRQLRTLPTHPGMIRYQQRESPNLLERYAEVMALGVTLLIALTSALVALLRMRRQQRKDKLDEYFVQAMAIRDKAKKAPKAADNALRLQQMQALRAEVIQLLVNEEIQPDITLLAFLLVCDQLSREAVTHTPA